MKEAKAGLLFPWNPVVKLNIGLDYNAPSFSGFGKKNQDFGQDLMKFKNINAYAGLRIFKYFGLETGFSRLGGQFEQNSVEHIVNIKHSYIDGKLFLPIFSLTAASLEGYLSVGISSLNADARRLSDGMVANSDVKTATKIGAGLEASFLGTVSARLGWYTLDRKLDMFEFGRLNVVHGGFSIYLL